MKWTLRILAGLGLMVGIPSTLFALVLLLTPPEDDDQRLAGWVVFSLLGVPPLMVVAGSMVGLHWMHQATLLAATREVEQIFVKLAHESQGDLTVIEFAAHSGLGLDEAKHYLDEQVLKLNGSTQVTNEGGIIYHFPV